MASIHARQRDPLLDQNTQALLERRGRELLGIAMLFVAFAFALMLGSHSADDPGLMVATQEPARNILGRFGAAVSSTLMIIGGKGTWMIPLILGAWGLRFVTHHGADRVMGRIVFAVIAIALGSVFAATLVPGATWPHSFGLGGLFGDTVLGALLGIAPLPTGLGLNLFSMILGGMLAVMGLWVTGFTMEELNKITRFLLNGSIFAYDTLVGLAGQGSQKAAMALAERRAQKAEARTMAAAYAAYDDPVVAGEWQPQPMGQKPARPATSIHRAQTDAEALAQNASEWGRPASLRGEMRADPRYPEPMAEAPHYAPPRERAGLLSRMPQLMRRMADPEPELVEPMMSLQAQEALAPDDDRIKARISDAIRARVRNPVASLNPITAAVQRREPPVARSETRTLTQRLRGPQPLLADTRPMPPVTSGGLPAEPPLTAAHAAAVKPTVVTSVTRTRVPVAPPAPPVVEEDSMTDWAAQANVFAPISRRPAEPEALPRLSTPRNSLNDYQNESDLSAADDQDHDEWQPDEDYEPDYDPAPVEAFRPVTNAPRFPSADPRKPVVQHAQKKQTAPSRKAMDEAQPRLRFDDPAPEYELPPLSLLTAPSTIVRNPLSDEALEENARMLENVLDDYGVKGEIVSVRPGPVVTMYELEPAPGLKASRVIGLADDIARSMSALSARVSTVPGRSVIGIELPNLTREKVVLREILSARDFGDSNMRLPLALGKDIGGEAIVANLAKMPHLLIAGTTGSGKSVAINTMILSLLYKLSPEECRMIMIDPKMLELSVYDGIPHLLSPVVTDPKKAVVALKWVVGEMEERYRKMSKMGVRNIDGYNGRVREALAKNEMFKRTIQTGFDDDTGEPVFETEEFQPVTIPYIVVIVDEMADLMMVAGKEIEACIQRLAQMARASGIHLIMATQRPSVDVITGTIKANFPTRISFQVTSKIDSRTILGEQGAEQLLGMGDMLYMGNGAKITRIHGPFVSDEEVEEIVNHLKSFGPPTYMSGVVEGPDEDSASDIDVVLGLSTGEGGDDILYDQAVAIVAKDRKCSTSYIQRKLGIGYNKAARLVEQMEDQGIVTAANHVGKREILVEER
jgi:DNA segregation ATPase FtsK/SpoIIIE, S-DNA-T family